MASDKVSGSRDPATIIIPKELCPAFRTYTAFLNEQSTIQNKLPSAVSYFCKNTSLHSYQPSSLRKLLDKLLTSIFHMKASNNVYRHTVATDMVRKNVSRTVTKTLLRTSEPMLKRVYEQLHGTNTRIYQHLSVLSHCRASNSNQLSIENVPDELCNTKDCHVALDML